MDKYSDIKDRILESAKSDDDIRAIIAIGSTTCLWRTMNRGEWNMRRME